MRRVGPAWLDPRSWLAVAVLLGVLAGCRAPTPAPADEAGAKSPTGAITTLIADLRGNDLAGYARHALPPEVHAGVARAWAEGRTLWPLTVLPLDARVPAMIDDLASPGGEQRWQASYRRQFAGEHIELKSAAVALGLFSVQHLLTEADLGLDERNHCIQLAKALSEWGARAPLGDAERARAAIPQLAAAARRTGLTGAEAFARAGMNPALQRLAPFFAGAKQVLAGYGLDVDAALAAAEVSLIEQKGDQAKVRVRYPLAGTVIDATVPMIRLGGHWYPADAVHHARRIASDEPPSSAASG